MTDEKIGVVSSGYVDPDVFIAFRAERMWGDKFSEDIQKIARIGEIPQFKYIGEKESFLYRMDSLGLTDRIKVTAMAVSFLSFAVIVIGRFSSDLVIGIFGLVNILFFSSLSILVNTADNYVERAKISRFNHELFYTRVELEYEEKILWTQSLEIVKFVTRSCRDVYNNETRDKIAYLFDEINLQVGRLYDKICELHFYHREAVKTHLPQLVTARNAKLSEAEAISAKIQRLGDEVLLISKPGGTAAITVGERPGWNLGNMKVEQEIVINAGELR